MRGRASAPAGGAPPGRGAGVKRGAWEGGDGAGGQVEEEPIEVHVVAV